MDIGLFSIMTLKINDPEELDGYASVIAER